MSLRLDVRRTARRAPQALDKFAASYASSLGQIRGLVLSLEALSIFAERSTERIFKDVVAQFPKQLEEHGPVLKKACARVYDPALRKTSDSMSSYNGGRKYQQLLVRRGHPEIGNLYPTPSKPELGELNGCKR